MSEMVERVARALQSVIGKDSWEELSAYNKENRRRLASIAIEAMREPTQAMYRAGAEAPQTVTEIYDAMIDEALK